MATNELKLWVARGCGGDLYLYYDKPKKNMGSWWVDSDLSNYLKLPAEWFPEVQWSDDEPLELVVRPVERDESVCDSKVDALESRINALEDRVEIRMKELTGYVQSQVNNVSQIRDSINKQTKHYHNKSIERILATEERVTKLEKAHDSWTRSQGEIDAVMQGQELKEMQKLIAGMQDAQRDSVAEIEQRINALEKAHHSWTRSQGEIDAMMQGQELRDLQARVAEIESHVKKDEERDIRDGEKLAKMMMQWREKHNALCDVVRRVLFHIESRTGWDILATRELESARIPACVPDSPESDPQQDLSGTDEPQGGVTGVSPLGLLRLCQIALSGQVDVLEYLGEKHVNFNPTKLDSLAQIKWVLSLFPGVYERMKETANEPPNSTDAPDGEGATGDAVPEIDAAGEEDGHGDGEALDDLLREAEGKVAGLLEDVTPRSSNRARKIAMIVRPVLEQLTSKNAKLKAERDGWKRIVNYALQALHIVGEWDATGTCNLVTHIQAIQADNERLHEEAATREEIVADFGNEVEQLREALEEILKYSRECDNVARHDGVLEPDKRGYVTGLAEDALGKVEGDER